jgi:hypothetical protein
MTARQADKGGFLLSETLTVFTLSAFILAGLTSISAVLLRSVDVSVARTQNADDLDRVVQALVRDIRTLVRAKWSGGERQPFVFSGEENRLLFVQPETASSGTPANKVVLLRAVQQGASLMRSEAVLPPFAASMNDLRFDRAVEVYRGARLRFGYVAAADGGVPAIPKRQWSSGDRLPQAILVEALDADGSILVKAEAAIQSNADIWCLTGRGCAKAMPTGAAPPPAPLAPAGP